MLIISRKIGLSLSALLLLGATAWSAAIQGDVRGPDGKPIAGAEVRLDRTDKKGAPSIVKTDRQGLYTFAKIEVGTYKVVAAAKDMAATASSNIKARSEGVVRVDFSLKKQTVAAAPKKKTHRVWMPPEPGTNIGGRYVDVPDNGTAVPAASPGVNPTSRTGNSAIRSMQQNGGMMPNVGGN